MLVSQSPAAVRKGTKSCTECRRRKVRCVRIPEDAPICRQCTERNTSCVAQTSSARPQQAQRLPSRYRIAQLEAQVNRLTKIVNNIEAKVGGNPSIEPEQTTAHSPSSDDFDGESSASEFLIAEEPAQLRSLFQNDWLSVDTDQRHELLQERRVKASAHLLESVRPSLQKLIPSKERTAEMMVCSYDWLQTMQYVLPQPSAPTSNQEILGQYEDMCRPDVGVVSLASWLLVVAITAHQVPQGTDTPENASGWFRKRIEFARNVSDTVEHVVMAHDRLVGTLEGLGMTIHFIRLQMARGNPQKSWLKLRHLIAIAELMGLPKAAQLARVKKANRADQVIQDNKVQLWEIICTIDRLSAMLINLPPYTRRSIMSPRPLLIDGVVQPAAYITRLMDITPKIYDMEDLSATEGSTARLYASALEIAREARELASQTPKSWWVINETDELKPDHIVQYMHYCVVMKAHLPVALRQDRSEEYLYSRLACIDACESIADRYKFIRRKLPSGFFTLRLLDLQAFAAMVSLLLTSHTSPTSDHRSFQLDKARLEGVVAEVLDLMEEKSKDGVGSGFAGHGANTLRALRQLLQQQDSNTAPVDELTVKVPLLGKVHIRRNRPTVQPYIPHSQLPLETVPQSTSWASQEQMLHAAYNPQLNTRTYMPDALLPGHGRPETQWESLSWSIEDGGDNLLDDALMAETFDQSALWQNVYYDIPFS